MSKNGEKNPKKSKNGNSDPKKSHPKATSVLEVTWQQGSLCFSGYEKLANEQRSAFGIPIPTIPTKSQSQSRNSGWGLGLILKNSGFGIGIWDWFWNYLGFGIGIWDGVWKIWDLGLGFGIEFGKFGIWDWDLGPKCRPLSMNIMFFPFFSESISIEVLKKIFLKIYHKPFL